MSSFYIKLGAPVGGGATSDATLAEQQVQTNVLNNIETELQAANISLAAIDANTDAVEAKLDNLETSKKARSSLVDEASPTVTYVCEAPASSLSSAAVWRIKRITTSGAIITVQWAAAGAYTQIADNRAALTYV